VKFFADGEEALAFLTNLPPAQPFTELIAIFLDLNLPGMSGVALLREIRRQPRVSQVPVIIMTGSLDPRDFEACQALKVAAFVPKPITFESFSKAITGLKRIPG
jgi:CheY-like chemotaxis protein